MYTPIHLTGKYRFMSHILHRYKCFDVNFENYYNLDSKVSPLITFENYDFKWNLC